MQYTVNQINSDGTISVTFTSATTTIPKDRATQTIDNITSKDQLDQYASDFEAGLQQEAAQNAAPSSQDSDLTAIVGKKQTVADTSTGA